MQLINIHPDFRSSVFYSGHVEIGVPWNEENTVDMMSYRYSNDDPSSGRIGSSKKLMPSIGIRNMAALKIFYSNCLHHKLTRYGSKYDMHKISKIQKFCLQSWIHKLKSSFFPNFYLELNEYSNLHIHHPFAFLYIVLFYMIINILVPCLSYCYVWPNGGVRRCRCEGARS